MTRDERLRRVLILCCHFARNLAYYRAGWQDRNLIRTDNFWKGVNGNCIDIAVLEWCKMFADVRGKHSWRRIASDPDAFSQQIFVVFGGEDTYEFYCNKFKTYRDKFIAHLDDELRAFVPSMDEAWETTQIYYHHVLQNEANPAAVADAPHNLSDFYDERFNEAREVYENGV